jgi:hypothetical protein
LVSQLLEQVGSVGKWLTNQERVFVVSGTFDPGWEDERAAQESPLRPLEEAGFGNAFLPTSTRAPIAPPGIGDYIFTQPLGCALNPRTLATPGFAHQPMTCDVELDPAKADRAQLSETQLAAACKAMAVEERLSRIEQQVQRQNQAYQEHVEALPRELNATREQNRELIRARIAKVKVEMETACFRLMSQAEADDGGEA